MSQRIQAFVCIFACFALASSGCSSDDAASDPPAERNVEPEETYLGLELPSNGLQIRSIGEEIKPGEDVEYCEVAQLPGDASEQYIVKSFEFANATGSHHLIVSAMLPGSRAEERVKELGVGNKIECFSAENAFGNEGVIGVGGTQQAYTEVVMPERVGRAYSGGQYIVFDYHYLNTREQPIQARSAFNMHLTDEASIDHIAKGFSFSNYTIATQPGSDGSFTGECHFRDDVVISDITRHTHRWGTDFSVWFAGGERDGEEIWTSQDWQHDTFYKFDEPFVMKSGEGLRFRCDYRNDTTRALNFGTSASDEMCILFGTIWETDGNQFRNQSCVIVWKDAQGIGHPAHEAGGFPKPTETEVNLCLSAGRDDACSRCRCESCASPAIQCAINQDCKAITDCYASCPAGTNCQAECRDDMDAHSSGLGVFQQQTSCFQSQCASECM
jgi:hypothetical protein